MTKKISSTRRQQAKKQQKQQRWLLIACSAIAVIGVVGLLLLAAGDTRLSVPFPDIHGMSFTGDGTRFNVATHTGIATYEDGNWSKPDLPVNDYMGYSGTEDGFYSSGHPGAGSTLINPIGLVNSQDFGATVTTINFSGETDFHVMGASYYGNTVYVLNPAQNSMLTPGLHYSLDGGITWQQSTANGLIAAPTQIAVHPTESNVVAVASQSGIFLSNDSGDSFTQITNNGIVTSIAFDPDGERLWFGFQTLSYYDLVTADINLLQSSPQIDTQQVIFYIAGNPVTDALAFSTSDRDIYYSENAGESWERIAADGVSN